MSMIRTREDTTPPSLARTDEPAVVQSLISIAKSTRALFGLKLAEIGLSSGQDEMLLALDEAEPQSISVLAERLSVRSSTVSKTVDRLERMGMAKRQPYKGDARQTLVRITPKGADLRRHVMDMRLKLEADLYSTLAADDAKAVAALRTASTCLQAKLRRLR